MLEFQVSRELTGQQHAGGVEELTGQQNAGGVKESVTHVINTWFVVIT